MDFMAYVASYEDLMNIVINNISNVHPCHHIEFIKESGKYHYERDGKREIELNIRENPSFNPWIYIANYSNEKDVHWNKIYNILDTDKACYTYITYGYPNKIVWNPNMYTFFQAQEILYTKDIDINLSNEERLRYCMQSVYNTTYYVNRNTFDKNVNVRKCQILDNYDNLKRGKYLNLHKNSGLYVKDLLQYFGDTHKHFIWMFGDSIDDFLLPTLTKTRKLVSFHKKSVLLNLNVRRHWGNISVVKYSDIDFHKKNSGLLWIGAQTGNSNSYINDGTIYKARRSVLVNKYDKEIYKKNNMYVSFSIQYMSVKSQLMYKFLLSVEGNDVASGLKWMLYSNSCVLMPMPYTESWLLEGKLIPWYHYVPINFDFSDLEEKYNWCLQNLDKCEKIAKNGNTYVSHFLNEKNELELNKEIVKRYLENVEIKVS